MCFILKPWAFIAVFVFALILIVTDVLVSRFQYPGDQFIAMLQALVAFFGYRGYRDLKSAQKENLTG